MFKKFIGDKKFYTLVLSIAIPLMIQQLIATSVNLIDNLMVGQLGGDAISGVAAVNRYYVIATFGINGLLAACTIYMAQYNGAKNISKLQETFRFAIISSLLFILVFFAAGLMFPQQIISYFTTDPIVIEVGIEYMKIAIFTYLPTAFSFAIATAFRAIGQTKTPMYIGIVAVIVNTILNYCLIFGNFNFPQMGVSGAALATLISRFVELAIYLFILKKSNVIFKSNISKLFNVSKDLIGKVTAKALPLCTNEILWSFGVSSLFKFYATRGNDVMAGYSISTTVADIFFALFAGMAVATTVLVSAHLGANELKEAKSNAYKILGFSVMLALLFGAGLFISSYIVPNFYNVNDAAKDVAQDILKIQGIMYWVYMFTAQCYFILRAGGDTKSTFFMDSGFMWLINLPIVGFFAYFTNVDIIMLYLIGQSTDLVKLLVSYKLLKREKWLVNLVAEH